jgi:hypothetical protein
MKKNPSKIQGFRFPRVATVMTIPQSAIAILFLVALAGPLQAERTLDRKVAEKLEVRHSMLGYRNTVVFYTFKDQQAILEVSVGNKDETFPVVGKIHLFDKAVSEEGLKKWINNQHSDALFPDIPNPIFTSEIPKGGCKVIAHKETGKSGNPGPRKEDFKDYEVSLSIGEHHQDKRFKLSAFTDTARVHVEQK